MKVFISQQDTYVGKSLCTIVNQDEEAEIIQLEDWKVWNENQLNQQAQEQENELNDESEESIDEPNDEQTGASNNVKEEDSKEHVDDQMNENQENSEENATVSADNEEKSPTASELALLSDVILLNLMDEESIHEAADVIKAVQSAEFDEPKTLVLVSTLHTWGAWTPEQIPVPDDISEEDEQIEPKLTEEFYVHRKPTPDYMVHHQLEEKVIHMAHDNLATCVIGSGLPYGIGENVLEPLFRKSWLGEDCRVPLISQITPNSFLPMIHVLDLATFAFNVALDPPSNKPYVVAFDHGKSTPKQVAEAIENELQRGKLPNGVANELSENETTEILVDEPVWTPLQLSVDFDDEALDYITEKIGDDPENWNCQSGFCDNINSIVHEFKVQRDLKPVRLVVFGPMHCGKSELCQKLAKEYYVPLVDTKIVVNTLLEENPVREPSEDNDDEEEEDTESEEYKREQFIQQLRQATNNGEKVDNVNAKLMQKAMILFLTRPQFANPGYVLDNWPSKADMQKNIFFLGEDEDDESEDSDEEVKDDEHEDDEQDEQEQESKKMKWRKSVKPTSIILVQAEDSIIKQRASLANISEKECDKRLKKYNESLKGLSEAFLFEAHDERYVVKVDAIPLKPEMPEESEDAEVGEAEFQVQLDEYNQLVDTQWSTLRQHIERRGKHFNYHPTPYEQKLIDEAIEAEQLCQELEAKRKLAERVKSEKLEQEEIVEAEKNERQRTLDRDAEILESRSKPLREYLMKHIMPILTQGLLECCAEEPEDPIDFLAEYLFQHKVESKLDLE